MADDGNTCELKIRNLLGGLGGARLALRDGQLVRFFSGGDGDVPHGVPQLPPKVPAAESGPGVVQRVHADEKAGQ